MMISHAHTETSDIIGGQRPSRTHEADSILFKQILLRLLPFIADICPIPDVFPAEPRPSQDVLSNWTRITSFIDGMDIANTPNIYFTCK